MKKTIKKFTSKVEVVSLEKEIELPAYFQFKKPVHKPSKTKHGDYFCTVFMVIDEKNAVCISSPRLILGEGVKVHSFSESFLTPYEIVNTCTQVDKREWDIAVQRVIQDVLI